VFTGIIEDIGVVEAIKKTDKFLQLSIRTKNVLKDSKVGDSISINGVCLTITDINNFFFKSDVIFETLNKTNLKFLKESKTVNLERAMTIKSRFDGHIVQGHIEGVGEIVSLVEDSDALILDFEIPDELLQYCIYKGSIAINGVSLTIAGIKNNIIKVCLIPHTLKNTTFINSKVGDLVNIETDVIAKYIKKYQTLDN
tara:strand:+ start:80 stop:673 length:594 start_codon:yes stop_codon:yes gene_type:complete